MGAVVKVRLSEGATAPSFQSVGAAGADISAYLTNGVVSVAPGEIAMIPTGVFLEIPAGFEVQVRPRSGLAIKFGLTVVNSPGTIDSDYRGEVKVGLINLGPKAVEISHGMRIAQLIFASVPQVAYQVSSEDLSSTIRGSGGFGSTGHC